MIRIILKGGVIDTVQANGMVTFYGAQVRACIELIKLNANATVISNIKLVRDLTGMGLREAKDLVTAAKYIMAMNIPPAQNDSWLDITINETWGSLPPPRVDNDKPATTLGELLRRKLEA